MKVSVKRGICARVPSGDVCCVGWTGDGWQRRVAKELVGRMTGTEAGRKKSRDNRDTT